MKREGYFVFGLPKGAEMSTVTTPAWFTIGRLIAVIVLVLAIVFMALGQLDYVTGALIAGLAIAELIP